MIYTTLNKIRAHCPCLDGWAKLLRHLGKTQADDEPLALGTILDSNGLDDALWCLRAVDGHQREVRLFAVWCARQVQHLMTDPRSLAALDVAERHANGQATDLELDEARAAAWATAWATALTAATRASAFAAARVTMSDAAWITARASASAAASAAAAKASASAAAAKASASASASAAASAAAAKASASASASAAASAAAAKGAAKGAATDAAMDAQAAEFRRVFCGEEVTA